MALSMRRLKELRSYGGYMLAASIEDLHILIDEEIKRREAKGKKEYQGPMPGQLEIGGNKAWDTSKTST